MKKEACQKSVSFLQATLYLWNLQWEKWEKPAFKFSDVLEYLNESRFHSCRTVVHYIEKWNPQSKYISSTSDYLAEYFVKTDFIIGFYDQTTVFPVRTSPC